jgi:hypothetical protein
MADAVGPQDYANVAVGAIIAASTFLMGKIVVENILKSRKERFDAKGQPPSAVKSKETTFDGVLKLVGVAVTLYQIAQQFPEVAAEARKYLP